MILPDFRIRKLCIPVEQGGVRSLELPLPMIEPFSENVQHGCTFSYGLSHAGYDLRFGNTYLIIKGSFNEILSPKRMKTDEDYLNRVFDKVTGLSDGDAVVIPSRSYILAYSKEYLRVPRNLKGTCVGKSTMARCGLHVNTTPLEPGWEGHLTIEIANHSPLAAELYVGEGCCQLEFHVLLAEPEVDYKQKKGKYQNQKAIPVPARICD